MAIIVSYLLFINKSINYLKRKNMKKQLAGVALVLVAVSLGSIQPVEACTRAVYIGPDQMVITGRTMDWKEDIMTNIYVLSLIHI